MGSIYAGLTAFMIDISGGGLNFARMILYYLVAGKIHHFWAFFVSNVIGGLIGGVVGNWFLTEKAEIDKLNKQERKRAKTNPKKGEKAI